MIFMNSERYFDDEFAILKGKRLSHKPAERNSYPGEF
jgi:hypothetical protein